MTLTITINCDNAAFHGPDEAEGTDFDAVMLECASILGWLVNEYEASNASVGVPTRLRDMNGNTVGQAVFEI